MTFLPLLLKLSLRLGLKLPKTPSFAVRALIPLSWFIATRAGRPLAVLAIIGTVLLFIPYFLIEPRFSFQDFMAKDSNALAAAESIDAGVGGVAPLYVSVPLKEGIPNIGDADFETVKTVHAIVEKHLGQNKVGLRRLLQILRKLRFSRDQILNAVGELKRRFVTPDGMKALVTGFMPTIIESNESRPWSKRSRPTSGPPASPARKWRLPHHDHLRHREHRHRPAARPDRLGAGQPLPDRLRLPLLAGALATAIPNLFPILGTEAWLWFSRRRPAADHRAVAHHRLRHRRGRYHGTFSATISTPGARRAKIIATPFVSRWKGSAAQLLRRH